MSKLAKLSPRFDTHARPNLTQLQTMSLGKVEQVICERYAAQGYAISRRNTKTLVVELPYGAQDFDEFVLDMRLNYGCKMDYDLTETPGKTVEIRITPGAHDIIVHSESEDEADRTTGSLRTTTKTTSEAGAESGCIRIVITALSAIGLLVAFTVAFAKAYPEQAERPPS